MKMPNRLKTIIMVPITQPDSKIYLFLCHSAYDIT